jgi:hypothetical protein
MTFYCALLSESTEGHAQVCLEWVEVKQSVSFLPAITKAEADQMLISIALCFAVVFIVRRVLDLLKY